MTRPKKPAGWVRALLDWYQENRRPMPWRRRPTPYAVWISEIMLQQTQVDTVTPYYKKFLKRFPNVKRLAQASEQDVLKCWEGLGYYSRARNLHKAAKQISNTNGGRLPSTASALQQLPGIGDYTAAAIASIVFGQAVPSIDGNVLRVMTRFRGIEDSITKPSVREAIRDDLQRFMPLTAPGDFNQALMELGATVCRSRSPFCDRCPLKRGCAARRAGIIDQVPYKPPRGPIPERRAVAGLLRNKRKMLVSKRPTDQLLGGLWEFPGGHCRPRESQRAALSRTIAETCGLKILPGRRLCTVEHAFSHFKLRLHVYECSKHNGTLKRGAESDELRWLSREELQQVPLSKVTLKILDALTISG